MRKYFKYLDLLFSLSAMAVLYNYFANGVVNNHIYLMWGFFIAIMTLLSFLGTSLKEKQQSLFNERMERLVRPIKNNINLTDEEKTVKIKELLMNEAKEELSKTLGV